MLTFRSELNKSVRLLGLLPKKIPANLLYFLFASAHFCDLYLVPHNYKFCSNIRGPDLLRSQLVCTNWREQSRILRLVLNRGLRVIEQMARDANVLETPY